MYKDVFKAFLKHVLFDCNSNRVKCSSCETVTFW